MTNFKRIYKQFLDENFITTFEIFKNTISTFPYYCNVIDINSYYAKITITESSIQNEIDDDILNYIDNLFIDKNNLEKYYFFSKTKFPLLLNEYKFNKDNKIFVENDYLKYYIFYDGIKWNINCEDYNDIYSILKKIEFEPNTLGELFNKYISIYKISFDKLNPLYNYIFGLTGFDSNLLMNEQSISKFVLISITSKKDDKIIPVTINQINKISPFLSYNKQITFSSKKSMMDFLDYNKQYKQIIINNNYINFTHYRRFRRVLNKLIKDPFKLIIRNYNENLFNELKSMFKGLNNYLNNYKTRIDFIVKYYYNLYKDEKILKKTNLVYQKYDKEIIMKIHSIYIQTQISITNDDILYILSTLQKRKTDYIYTRFI